MAIFETNWLKLPISYNPFRIAEAGQIFGVFFLIYNSFLVAAGINRCRISEIFLINAYLRSCNGKINLGKTCSAISINFDTDRELIRKHSFLWASCHTTFIDSIRF